MTMASNVPADQKRSGIPTTARRPPGASVNVQAHTLHSVVTTTGGPSRRHGVSVMSSIATDSGSSMSSAVESQK